MNAVVSPQPMPPTDIRRPPRALLPGPWKLLATGERDGFAQRLHEHLKQAGLSTWTEQHDVVQVFAAQPRFYPGYALLSAQVQRRDGLRGTLDVLMGPGFIGCLDGRSALIHSLNDGLFAEGETSPLGDLSDPGVAADYLRFYCNAVRGEHGSFRIVETADDLRDGGVTDLTSAPPGMMFPMDVQAVAEDRRRREGDPVVHAKACVLYGGALFGSRFEIDRLGQVDMVDDTTLITDIAPLERTEGLLRAVELPAGGGL